MKFECRICSQKLGKPIVLLEKMPLTDDFISVKDLNRREYLANVEIFECEHCGLVQNPSDFNHEKYYGDYQYSTGHSVFTKEFMDRYASFLIDIFVFNNGRPPKSSLEIGSGDGMQLQQFVRQGVLDVLGIEPSDYLAKIAEESAIPTIIDLFGMKTVEKLNKKFDICLSSYTLDHVRNPAEYLMAVHHLLNDGGVIAFEIHNLEKIIERAEYCLFEHEHTIYLTPSDATRFLEQHGFKVLAVDPIPQNKVRANSLIVVAEKSAVKWKNDAQKDIQNHNLKHLNTRIRQIIERIEGWVASIPEDRFLIGFGAGGRGVMTLAALHNSSRFTAIFDSNYQSNEFLTPKTRIPVLGSSSLTSFADSYCLVFSYGYISEIREQLIEKGFSGARIFSLADFF